MKKYTFEVSSDYDHLSEHHHLSQDLEYALDDVFWPQVLKEFVHFLAHDFGYDLDKKVAIIDADGEAVSIADMQ